MDVSIVDALGTGRLEAARDITFEYVALTQGEVGFVAPQRIQDLPTALRTVLDSLADNHRPPGALLLAMSEEQIAGTVGMRASTITAPRDALVQRLYVRTAWRRRGVARRLMAAIHEIAAREGFDRLVLNVTATRTAAQQLYRDLGYQPMTAPVDWSYGGVWLCRSTH